MDSMTTNERLRALERECRITNERVNVLETQLKILATKTQTKHKATSRQKSAAATTTATNSSSASFCKIMFDGGSRGNPGLCGSGYIIYPCITADYEPHKEVPPITGCSVVSENETNNYAEYMGLILGLEKAKEQGFTHIFVQGDSKLVINHLSADWKCGDKLRPLYERAAILLAGFHTCTLQHVPREKNAMADSLVNKAMDNN